MKRINLAVSFFLFINFVNAQNIGIGTVTPTRAKFEVHGAVDATSAIFGGEGSGISLQRSWPAIGFNHYWNAGDRYIFNGHGSKLFMDPNSGYMSLDMFPYNITNAVASTAYRAFTISPLGYIGLGGAPTHAQLQFPNTIDNRKILLWETGINDHQYYGLGINGGTLRYQVDAVGAAHRFYAGTSSSSSNLLMSIWGDKKVLISNSSGGGFLGINLNAVSHTLSVRQAGNTGLYIEEAGSATNWQLRAVFWAPTSYPYFVLDHNGSQVGRWENNGNYSSNSDSRLKRNISNMPEMLGKIMQLQPKSYEFNDNPTHKKSLGFIAQDVKALFPELVFISANSKTDGTGIENLHSLNYAGFGVIAIKAIQEQQQIIEELRNQVEAVKAEIQMQIGKQQMLITNLQNQIDDLKRLVEEFIRREKSKK